MTGPATATHALLLVSAEVPAIMAMQEPIPKAANIISLRRPNRSTVSTPIGEQSVCQVNTDAPKMRASTEDSPKYVSNIVVT